MRRNSRIGLITVITCVLAVGGCGAGLRAVVIHREHARTARAAREADAGARQFSRALRGLADDHRLTRSTLHRTARAVGADSPALRSTGTTTRVATFGMRVMYPEPGALSMLLHCYRVTLTGSAPHVRSTLTTTPCTAIPRLAP
jgi:hypothetical protein